MLLQGHLIRRLLHVQCIQTGFRPIERRQPFSIGKGYMCIIQLIIFPNDCQIPNKFFFNDCPVSDDINIFTGNIKHLLQIIIELPVAYHHQFDFRIHRFHGPGIFNAPFRIFFPAKPTVCLVVEFPVFNFKRIRITVLFTQGSQAGFLAAIAIGNPIGGPVGRTGENIHAQKRFGSDHPAQLNKLNGSGMIFLYPAPIFTHHRLPVQTRPNTFAPIIKRSKASPRKADHRNMYSF